MEITISDLKKQLETTPTDCQLWLKLGHAIADEGDFQGAINAFSMGLIQNPFNSELHLQRGRKFIASGRYAETIAEITLAARLNPYNWENWYYMSVAYNLDRQYEKSAEGFEECIKHMPSPASRYPVVDWLFTTYNKLDEKEKAKTALELIDHNIPSSTMDYSYRKRVMLFKGLINPEEFIDEAEIKRSCLTTKDRPVLEMITQLYGLANYYSYIGEMEKSNEALKKLINIPLFHNGFGYIKGMMDAKDRGLI